MAGDSPHHERRDSLRNDLNSGGGLLAFVIALGLVSIFFFAMSGGDSRDMATEPGIHSLNHEAHAPIIIDSDAEFATMASAEGWPGDGSLSNPYFISNYSISASGGQQCVLIGNTTLHFVIWNCELQGASEAGVKLINAAGGRVAGNNCTTDGWYGVVVIGSRNATVEDNNCTQNQYGIRVSFSENITLSGNNCSANGEGIYIYYSEASNVNNNTCIYNNETGGFAEGLGIHLLQSSLSIVENNTCSWNIGQTTPGSGIYLDNSDNNTIARNTCTNHDGPGIVINQTSNDNAIVSNVCTENWGGIIVWLSYNNSVDGNNCSSNGYGGGGILVYQSTGNSLSRNICLLNEALAFTSVQGHGIHALFNSNRNQFIENNCSYNEGDGILVETSSGCEMINNVCGLQARDFSFQWGHGIQIRRCSNFLAIGNNCSYNGISGIYTAYSSGVVLNNSCYFNQYDGIRTYTEMPAHMVSIKGNKCSGNLNHGIELQAVTSTTVVLNSVEENDCSWNLQAGIFLVGSNTTVMNNVLYHNSWSGIAIYSCEDIKLRGNTMLWNGVTISYGSFNTHDIDTSNTVDGKPVYYYKNQTSGTVPSGAGQVILANCDNMVIQHQDISNTSAGILLANSNWNVVHNSTCIYGRLGIHLISSDDNRIENCTFGFNTEYGMYLTSSSNRNMMVDNALVANRLYGIYMDCPQNRIWNNSFVDNNGAGSTPNPDHIQAYDASNNFWNSTAGRGNYWSDWTFPDSDYDGIVDFPYEIAPVGAPVVQDNYPLAAPTVEMIPELGLVSFSTVSIMLIAAMLVMRRRWNPG